MNRVCNNAKLHCCTFFVKSPCVRAMTQEVLSSKMWLYKFGTFASISTALHVRHDKRKNGINPQSWQFASRKTRRCHFGFHTQYLDAASHPEFSSNLASRDLVNIIAPKTIDVYFCPEPFWKGGGQYLQNEPGLCSTICQSDQGVVKPDKTLKGKTSPARPYEMLLDAYYFGQCFEINEPTYWRW